VTRLNQAIQKAKRRLVVITDPHIAKQDDYPVYAGGSALEGEGEAIFVKDTSGSADYVGQCWPGKSVWVDYLSKDASDYWGTLYSTKSFLGQSYLYGAWNDMNEPSVFAGDSLDEINQLGMPVHNVHTYAKGTSSSNKESSQVMHMFVHNAYGALMSRATYKGLLQRDNN